MQNQQFLGGGAHEISSLKGKNCRAESQIQRKIAFTLAEVLITLGIIGVVAALTLPVLIQRQQEKEITTGLLKFYSSIQQSYLRVVEANGTPDTWGITKNSAGHDLLYNLFSPYMKFVKKCEEGEVSTCYKPKTIYKFLDGTTYFNNSEAYDLPHGVLADGMIVEFEGQNGNCTQVRGEGKYLQSVCGAIYVDVNGQKGDNTLGKDMFAFYITKYGMVPLGTAEENVVYSYDHSFDSSCSVESSKKRYGYGCTAWVIANGNRDYLRCGGLSWSGRKKCE